MKALRLRRQWKQAAEMLQKTTVKYLVDRDLHRRASVLAGVDPDAPSPASPKASTQISAISMKAPATDMSPGHTMPRI